MVLLKLPLVAAFFGVCSEAALGLLPWNATAANQTWTPVTDPFLGAPAKKVKRPLIPYTYIIKLSSNNHDLSTRDLSPHQAFHKRAESLGTYTTRHEYTNSSLFLGLSLTLSSTEDVQAILNFENVEKIWPVYSVSRPLAAAKPRSLLSHTRSDSNLETRDSNTTLPRITYSSTPSSPLQMSNVDKLHASGIKGTGVKIAVIDTGVDYRHPSLGGCFGPGCKISFGYDLVGDDYPDTTVPSPDPLTTCAEGGHGTHVMGIIGMEDGVSEGFGLAGVAPEAALGMYRVFGCDGSAGSDVVIAGMLMAASDGADVISMSLGSLSPSEADDPFKEITETLRTQGIAVIVAAGNDGNLGPFSASAPAIGTTVLAIGSVDNKNFPVTYQLSDTRGRRFRYASVFPINATSAGMSIIILADGEVSDVTVCYEFEFADAAAKLVDPDTTILAIKTGRTCTTTTKVQAAAGYGFKYIMLYSTADSEVTSYLDYFAMGPLEDSAATLAVTAENALSIISETDKNPAYKLFFDSTTASNYLAQSPVQVTGGFMSNYSSFGPSTELNMKPQLSAPGGNILSTWPLSAGGYAILSGTSMATPFAAGCYALVKSQLSSLSVNEIFNLLMNTASPLSWFYDTAILSSAAHQGTGLLDPRAAITYESIVSPQQLNLGTSAAPIKKTITIKNRSTRSKTYVLSHKPAGVVNGGEYRTDFISQTYPFYASISFSSPTITVPGSSSTTIEITITPPAGISPALQPVYSGYILLTNNNDHFLVPYVGEPWDPNTVSIIAETVPWKLKYPDADGNYIIFVPAGLYPATQFLIAPTHPDTTRQDFFMGGLGYPELLFGTTQACDYIRFDAVPANTTFVPDIYGYDPKVTYEDLVYPAGNVTEVLGLDVVKTIVEYEGPFGLVGSTTYKWLDAKLPLGDYRVVMRVLRPGRDYEDPKAWNSWMSAVARFE